MTAGHERIRFLPGTRAFSLGAEAELQVLSGISLQLSPMAPELIARCSHIRVVKEMFPSTLKVLSAVHERATALQQDMESTYLRLSLQAELMVLLLSGTGTHPQADHNDRVITNGARYDAFLLSNQWHLRHKSVYGLHVHVGMPTGDACIRCMNHFLNLVPHLLALSASSPFRRGGDSGMAASRPTVIESHPPSALSPVLPDWDAFASHYDLLRLTGSIQDHKDLWWDVRPNPALGTVELRMCDGPATITELGAIVAFVHVMALRFAELDMSRLPIMPAAWVLRENKWRAIRHGLSASIVQQETYAVVSLREDLMALLHTNKNLFRELGYDAQLEVLQTICRRGNSADRQRATMSQTNDVEAVVRHNVMEFTSGEPHWP